MKNRLIPLMIALLLCVPFTARALDFSSMFKSKPPLTEEERKETIDRIKKVQDQLKLLQDKLRALEKRKAMEQAAKTAGEVTPETIAGEVNWQEIDQTTVNPGESGLYTYLLCAGDETDNSVLGSLEDLILTIETLPPSTEPAAIGNRFLLPVEPRQSTVVLARRPYDFKLSRSYLERLGLGSLPPGPVLVSLNVPLDPYGLDMAPPYLAVALGRQDPRRSLALLKVWHGFEKAPVTTPGHPVADLFWQLLDGAGPTRVVRSGGQLLIDLAPAPVPPQQPAPPAN